MRTFSRKKMDSNSNINKLNLATESYLKSINTGLEVEVGNPTIMKNQSQQRIIDIFCGENTAGYITEKGDVYIKGPKDVHFSLLGLVSSNVERKSSMIACTDDLYQVRVASKIISVSNYLYHCSALTSNQKNKKKIFIFNLYFHINIFFSKALEMLCFGVLTQTFLRLHLRPKKTKKS